MYRKKKGRKLRLSPFSVPKTGVEPAHLAAPPPEDGASTISPLGQRANVHRILKISITFLHIFLMQFFDPSCISLHSLFLSFQGLQKQWQPVSGKENRDDRPFLKNNTEFCTDPDHLYFKTHKIWLLTPSSYTLQGLLS